MTLWSSMARRRSSLAELERVLRALQPGSHNLGHYLAAHSDQLSLLLGVDADQLRGLARQSDEEAAPRIHELLQRRAETSALRHQAARREATMGAAQQLAATALWQANAVSLDVTHLLGGLLADPNSKYIGFISPAFEVHLPRKKLVEAAHVLPRQYTDLVSWVDAAGLHFRWRRGRGGLTFYPQSVPASEASQVLLVNIPAPAVEKPRPTPAFRARQQHVAPRPAPAKASTPAHHNARWLAEALTEITLSA
jgi:hypothetical protein